MWSILLPCFQWQDFIRCMSGPHILSRLGDSFEGHHVSEVVIKQTYARCPPKTRKHEKPTWNRIFSSLRSPGPRLLESSSVVVKAFVGPLSSLHWDWYHRTVEITLKWFQSRPAYFNLLGDREMLVELRCWFQLWPLVVRRAESL